MAAFQKKFSSRTINSFHSHIMSIFKDFGVKHSTFIEKGVICDKIKNLYFISNDLQIILDDVSVEFKSSFYDNYYKELGFTYDWDAKTKYKTYISVSSYQMSVKDMVDSILYQVNKFKTENGTLLRDKKLTTLLV